MQIDPPFSARSRGEHQQVENDFPTSARTGLLHLLYDLVEKKFVANWVTVTRELQRIGRFMPQEYDLCNVSSVEQAKRDAESILNALSWQCAYDFCERLYGHLAVDVGYEEQYGFNITTSRSEVQSYIASELQRLFLEEDLAYEFANGLVSRRGRKHSVEKIARAQVVLGDSRLRSARMHYAKALQFYRDPKKPDFENVVKEAVCACEAAGKELFPQAKASTLGELAKWLSNSKSRPIPKSLAQTITGIYAYRSGGNGIGHGGATGGVATTSIAEYVLAVTASQIIYLFDMASEDEDEIPF